MSRYIDADTLKVSITKYGELHISHKKLPVVKNEAKELIRDICFAIDEKSTADVVPVVHGRWVDNGTGGHECNVCHICAPSFRNGRENLSSYCPLCGARMS